MAKFKEGDAVWVREDGKYESPVFFGVVVSVTETCDKDWIRADYHSKRWGRTEYDFIDEDILPVDCWTPPDFAPHVKAWDSHERYMEERAKDPMVRFFDSMRPKPAPVEKPRPVVNIKSGSYSVGPPSPHVVGGGGFAEFDGTGSSGPTCFEDLRVGDELRFRGGPDIWTVASLGNGGVRYKNHGAPTSRRLVNQLASQGYYTWVSRGPEPQTWTPKPGDKVRLSAKGSASLTWPVNPVFTVEETRLPFDFLEPAD